MLWVEKGCEEEKQQMEERERKILKKIRKEGVMVDPKLL